jgi:tetratricopeptide (TPR) repeat protein
MRGQILGFLVLLSTTLMPPAVFGLNTAAETRDPGEQGIEAYGQGRYAQAEELLSRAVAEREKDIVETLRFLGAAQFAQAKYCAAAETFRKALALREEMKPYLSAGTPAGARSEERCDATFSGFSSCY